MTRSLWLGAIVALAFAAGTSPQAMAQSQVVGWGDQVFNSAWNDEHFVEIAAGGNQTVARHGDGSVVAWGANGDGQCIVPVPPSGLSYIQIATGGIESFQGHIVALRSDGSAIAWGNNGWGECIIPALPPGLAYVEVAAGMFYTVARRSDGSVVAWGLNDSGQCNVPAPPAGLTYTEVAAGYNHVLARLGVKAK